MDKIYIKVEDMNRWIAKYFPNKDIVTVDDLLAVIEDLDTKLGNKEIEYEELENNLEENFKPKSAWELYDVNENDFH